jgi:hypothetical protein
MMVKSCNGQVHIGLHANKDRNDPEGLHVCYPCNNTKILGLLMCKTFLAIGG